MKHKYIHILKKSGKLEPYNQDKIINAIGLAAADTKVEMTDEQNARVLELIDDRFPKMDQNIEITVNEMHDIVLSALRIVRYDVATEYAYYRKYKMKQKAELDKLQRLRFKSMSKAEEQSTIAESYKQLDDYIYTAMQHIKTAMEHIDSSLDAYSIFTIISNDAIRKNNAEFIQLMMTDTGLKQIVSIICNYK